MRHIVIAGGGTAGWMAAAALGRFLGHSHKISLIESDTIGTVGVGEATIPQIRTFNAGLGIDEQQFVVATQGTFKLGIEFSGWGSPDAGYIHAFGNIGRPLGLIDFHHYWLRGFNAGIAADLWSASASALAAKENRFSPPNDQPGHLPSGVAYAFQFDAGLYAKFLREFSQNLGVQRIEGEITDVVRDAETGDIALLSMANGQKIAGDFFIDCSGFQALLIEGALQSGYEDWSHLLPCDRALAVPSERTAPLTPYTRASARKAGWQWRIPLQHRTGNGHVYSSTHVSDDEAASILLSNLDGKALADPKMLKFKTGKRRQIWKNNCVALGLSAGFLEPLESTSIHLVQSSIARLLQLLPGGKASDSQIAEFNRQADFEWSCVCDFIILHYYANGRDEPFWQAVRNMKIPPALAHKIELFRSTGTLFRQNDELFTEMAWLQVLWGQGVAPISHHPIADQLSDKDLAEFLGLADQHSRATASKMMPHEDFITRFVSASKGGSAPLRNKELT
jgi:tryptophan 7-halogenase